MVMGYGHDHGHGLDIDMGLGLGLVNVFVGTLPSQAQGMGHDIGHAHQQWSRLRHESWS